VRALSRPREKRFAIVSRFPNGARPSLAHRLRNGFATEEHTQ